MGNETTMTMDLPVNRTYKSTVFTMLYADRGNLLDLYNAMTGKHYDDPELLEINTLENAIYMTIKNDVSFLIDGRLSLYEHQSTKNPNLPLRFLLYISHLYSRMTKDENLYGTAKVRIPAPEFVVFYNGREQMPERDILKLSDLFMVNDRPIKLELEAVVLNISGENNRELKAACQTLREFLENHRMEARAMSIFEYDQEKHMRQEREAAWKEGRRSGLEEGREQILESLIRKKLAKGKTVSEIAGELEETEEHIKALISKMKA